METFIEFVMKKLQTHIGQSFGKVAKPENKRITRMDENRLRNKANNLVRLHNREEIKRENAEELNSNVIKAEMNSIILRSLTDQ
jgi:hypothetical protein